MGETATDAKISDHRLWLARYTHMREAVAQRRDAPQLFEP
jgi:hypothetical protein